MQASSAASELFEVLDRKLLLDTGIDTGEKRESIVSAIGFRQVEFSYPTQSDFPVLKGISFDCPANKVTALVGASGSGKSTIVALLKRWYQPSMGHITLDGKRIDDLNVRWLRSQLRLVQQVSCPRLLALFWMMMLMGSFRNLSCLTTPFIRMLFKDCLGPGMSLLTKMKNEDWSSAHVWLQMLRSSSKIYPR